MRFGPILSVPARFNQKEPVPFQEILPLKLRNRVSGKGDRRNDVACLHEMSILFACLKRQEFDQPGCANEIANFQKCYMTSLDKKRIKEEHELKGVMVPGQKSYTSKQINTMLKKFPNLD